jgi:kinesin family protein 4/21/27
MQENLQRVKDEKDTLQTEKNRSDSLLRELQAQVLARSSSPPNGRPVPDRNLSYPRAGLPAMKFPPPTPPPSVPPPPAPRANGDATVSTSSHNSSGLASSSSRDSQPESPMTSVGHSVNGSVINDPKTTARLEQQAKQIDEQEVMIKTLNKQLTHCESDLQTHMDLVSTLETSLGDSEKNRESFGKVSVRMLIIFSSSFSPQSTHARHRAGTRTRLTERQDRGSAGRIRGNQT